MKEAFIIIAWIFLNGDYGLLPLYKGGFDQGDGSFCSSAS